jgi:hypothetical protein
MHNAADDTAVVHSFLTANIRRQIWLDPLQLLVAQPKLFPAHDRDPFLKRTTIVLSEQKD